MRLLQVLIKQIEIEFLVSSSEHQPFHACLPKCQLPDLISGSLKNSYVSSKRSFLWGVVKMLFSCPNRYSSLLLISQHRIVEYTLVPTSRRPKENPARATRIPYRHSPSSSPPSLCNLTVLAQDSKADGGYFVFP